MHNQTINKQTGSVLAISLVLLTAITLLAAMSMQRAGLQTRITANILHKELLFNSALNEQESWFANLRRASTGDPLLSEPLRTFSLDANGTRTYSPVLMNTLTVPPGPIAITLENQLITVGITPGINALVQGQEAGSRVLYKYQLWSSADIARRIEGRSSPEYQVTGISFPGLNTTKNSLFSAP